MQDSAAQQSPRLTVTQRMIASFGRFVGVFFASQPRGTQLCPGTPSGGAIKHESCADTAAANHSCRRRSPRHAPAMANSRFQYVKKFELSDALLPDTYLIARLDGHRFTKFTKEHNFTKPNDERGLLLMAEVGRHLSSSVSTSAGVFFACGLACNDCYARNSRGNRKQGMVAKYVNELVGKHAAVKHERLCAERSYMHIRSPRTCMICGNAVRPAGDERVVRLGDGLRAER